LLWTSDVVVENATHLQFDRQGKVD